MVPVALTEVERLLRQLGDVAVAERFALRRQGFAHPDLRVVVFGEFNRGKSTLLNAILGRELLSSKLVPTTGITTTIVYDDFEEGVTVRYGDGREETHPLDTLASFATLDAAGTGRADIDAITVQATSPLLADGLILVDTPGVGEQQAQTRRALDAVGSADLVLLVLDARQLLGAAERDFAAEWMTRKLGKPVTPVVNFMSFVEVEEQPDLRDLVDRWCRTGLRAALGRPWYEVDALTALKHAVLHGPKPMDDFDALVSALVGCRGNERRAIQRLARVGQLQADLEDTEAANAAALADLRTDAERVARERQAVTGTLTDLRRRLDAEADGTRLRLAAAVDARFDEQFTLLQGLMKGENKASLAANAPRWFSERLTEATRGAERAVIDALYEMAGDLLEKPEPLTVAEEMALAPRPSVSAPPPPQVPGQMVARAAVVGGSLGTWLIPVPFVGTLVGAAAGGLLAKFLGGWAPAESEAVVRGRIEEQWAATRAQATGSLLAQYDARVQRLSRDLDGRLANAVPLSALAEIAARTALARAVADCQGQLLTT